MQKHTEDAGASISTKNVREGPNQNANLTFAVPRKAGKRTLPRDLATGELNLVSPPHADDIPATKKPRLQEPFSVSKDEADTKISSRDNTVSLPDAAADNADPDPVKGTRATSRWTPEEDARLNSAVTITCKMKHGQKCRIDWTAVAALVGGRVDRQCRSRWYNALNPNVDQAKGRTGNWTAVEDSQLRKAAQTHGGKKWGAIAALVPGRTKNQCSSRWSKFLNSNVDPSNGRKGKWDEDEDSKLKDAVQTHGGKNWAAIAALVPGRAASQCCSRWTYVLEPNIDRANGRTGKWDELEDRKLGKAVKKHGGRNWAAIAALVPGRAEKQCHNRWKDILKPNNALDVQVYEKKSKTTS
jgi:hypothetical protein